MSAGEALALRCSPEAEGHGDQLLRRQLAGESAPVVLLGVAEHVGAVLRQPPASRARAKASVRNATVTAAAPGPAAERHRCETGADAAVEEPAREADERAEEPGCGDGGGEGDQAGQEQEHEPRRPPDRAGTGRAAPRRARRRRARAPPEPRPSRGPKRPPSRRGNEVAAATTIVARAITPSGQGEPCRSQHALAEDRDDRRVCTRGCESAGERARRASRRERRRRRRRALSTSGQQPEVPAARPVPASGGAGPPRDRAACCGRRAPRRRRAGRPPRRRRGAAAGRPRSRPRSAARSSWTGARTLKPIECPTSAGSCPLARPDEIVDLPESRLLRRRAARPRRGSGRCWRGPAPA